MGPLCLTYCGRKALGTDTFWLCREHVRAASIANLCFTCSLTRLHLPQRDDLDVLEWYCHYVASPIEATSSAISLKKLKT